MVPATYVRLRSGKYAVRVALVDVGRIGADGRVEVARRDGGVRIETIYGPISSDATYRIFTIRPARAGGNDPDKDI